MLDGAVIAEGDRALRLLESRYPPRLYLPMDDVRPGMLNRTAKATYCPFKGEAAYWRLGERPNVAWGYPTPYDDVSAIAGHVCFDDSVEGIEVRVGAD